MKTLALLVALAPQYLDSHVRCRFAIGTGAEPPRLGTQEETLDSLLRRLGSESWRERERAALEIKRRGDAAMTALVEAERRATDPAERARLRRALEEILGRPVLTPEGLKAKKVTWRTEGRRLRDALPELARVGGLVIEVDGDPAADPKLAPAEFADQSLDAILDAVTRQVAACWLIDESRVLVFVPGKVPIRIYDIRDLTAMVLQEPAFSLDPMEPDRPLPSEGWQPLTGEDVCGLIKQAVHPKDWQESDGKTVQFQNGMLIARHDADVLRELEPYLEGLRRRFLAEVRMEIEAYAVRPGTNVEEGSLERLREAAAKGKQVRCVSAFDRTVRRKRPVAFASLVRTLLVTRYEESGAPVPAPVTTGTKLNLRASLDEERESVRVDLEAGWSRLLSVEKKKTEQGDLQIPTVANHTLRTTATVTAGKAAILGRLDDTRIVDGLSEIVLIGRFTPVERK